MKIGFVIPTEVATLGCRYLSSYLRSKGHDTRLVFIPNLIPTKDGIRYARDTKYECSENLFSLIADSLGECDIVGFSLLAQFHEPLADISNFLREKTNVPTIWGGVHPTQAPEICAPFADMVCIGDGEETLLETISAIQMNQPWQDVPGLLYLDKFGEPVRTPFRKPLDNLDSYPLLDFSFSDHYFVDIENRNEEEDCIQRLVPL